MKKIWQGLWVANFSSLAWKMAKIAFIYVAQWSKQVKSHIDKNLITVLWKKSGKGSVVKISALKHEKWQTLYFWCCKVVKNGQKLIWKRFDHCFMKEIWQGVCCENFSFLAWKMAKLAFLMLHSGQNWWKKNLKKKSPLFLEKEQARGLWWKFQPSKMKNCS